MEALWRLEEKWKITTQEALTIFLCTLCALIGACTIITILLKRKTQLKNQVIPLTQGSSSAKHGNGPNWVTIRMVLMGSLRWSGPSKLWEEDVASSVGSWREVRSPEVAALSVAPPRYQPWRSHNSESPVWQRPILMGEKCELPRFSGLILYDEMGHLLDHNLASRTEYNDKDTVPQGNAVLRNEILKDIL